jgi:tetratricopeptide (TPR) repeat protein
MKAPNITKTSASKIAALTTESLERLGTSRLAQPVLELSDGNVVVKRRLKIELSGPDGAGRAVAKRLATIGKSKSYVDWRKVRVVQSELLDQRAAILELVAPSDPGTALDLMWQFLALAKPLLDRAFDKNNLLVPMFCESLPMLVTLAQAAKPLPGVLAAHVKDALLDNGYATYAGLLEQIGPVLGQEGLDSLKALVTAALDEELPRDQKASHIRACSKALQAIADAQGDVDAFIEAFPPQTRNASAVSAQIGARLLKAGRAGEALAYLDASLDDIDKSFAPWEAARADALEALGRQDEAQAFRMACFHRSLNTDLLRAFIKRLPDFDDEEALDQALLYAQNYPDITKAIAFLIDCPAHRHAAARIIKDSDQLDGNAYDWLTELAKTIDDNHPLAATLVRRAVVAFTLTNSKTKRYKYAARHIRACAISAAHIDDWHGHEDHETWLTPLMADHARKFGVWDHL